ncbi:MAG: leucine--tRNA ligase [Halobacteria archaeon]
MSSENYDPNEIEEKWQKRWREEEVFRTGNDGDDPEYVLGMFPYPSGKMHMGHVRNYSITDAYSRYRKMSGDDVLHPMGWDSFGMPAENAALERDTNPRDWTYRCIDDMREQMESMGFGYDWSREVTTCDPGYYRWNQWFFKQFMDEGLVDYKKGEVNWCPSCETVLANEQVEEGECWRCDTPVEDEELDQWYFKITEYAQELLDGLEELDGWPDSVREMQRNWIGRQEGATAEFEIQGHGDVEIFTTRLDTIYGSTFLALAPEHPVAEDIAEDSPEVREFIDEIDPEREPGGEKKGVYAGVDAVNPVNGEEIPVYIADFVMMDVGTGGIMAVPAHDERDHEFAKKHGIEIKGVVEPAEAEGTSKDGDDTDGGSWDFDEEAYTDDGVLVESGDHTGLESEEARKALVSDIESADTEVTYRLRDWLISRQRYWGTPIPIVHCPDCGEVPVPDEDLPVELPEFVRTSGNPLDEVEEFVETECPECGGEAERETDTMDTFVDSSWYFLRYISPSLDDAPFEKEYADDWMPVDSYVGGIEHAIMHLLYARFFTRVLNDLDLVDVEEPFEQLVTQGMVLLEGDKMSKSKGNVVSPQCIVEEYGADTARLFMMEAALPDKDFNWTEKGVKSNHRFLNKLYRAVENCYDTDSDVGGADDGTGSGVEGADRYLAREIDATVKEVTEDYENFHFNRAVREIKDLVSTLDQYLSYVEEPDNVVVNRGLEVAVKGLAPVAPHLMEELWSKMGEGLVAEAAWPSPERELENYVKEKKLVESTRKDVREIKNVADIENPDRIRIVVAPDWKHTALEHAIESDGTDVIGGIMGIDEVRRHGDEAASYGQFLQKNHRSLEPELDDEVGALEMARWLFEKEFDAEIVIENAEVSDSDRADKARPGKPAIEIE